MRLIDILNAPKDEIITLEGDDMIFLLGSLGDIGKDLYNQKPKRIIIGRSRPTTFNLGGYIGEAAGRHWSYEF